MIIYTLREKATHNFRELRHHFIINDPMGIGNLRREALGRVLTRLLFWPVQQKHIIQLIKQLGFPKDKQLINFTEFYAALCSQNNNDYSSHGINTTSLNHINDLVANCSNNEKQSIPMKSTEKNNSSIASMDQLNHSIHNVDDVDDVKENWSFLTELSHNDLNKRKYLLGHQVMGIIRQRLLKGSLKLEELFDVNSYDGENQFIQRESFFHRLSQLRLFLSRSEFLKLWKRLSPNNELNLPIDHFLQHMNLKGSNNADNNELQSNDTLIGYRRICKTIEYYTKQYINKQNEDNEHSIKNLPNGYTIADIFLSTLSYLKLPLIHRIQIGSFFTRYGLMIKHNNLLPYNELFRRFQDRTEAGVLHQMMTDTLMTKRKSYNNENENILQLEHELIQRFHGDYLHLLNTLRYTENYNPSIIVIDNDELVDSSESNLSSRKKTTTTQQRTLKELKQLIHQTLKLHLHEIEKRFYELDEMNSGCLTQEQLYQLLKVFNIQPEITRGEIRKLWPEFFIDQRHCLSFHEFLRYFLYCKLDAAYPNAKISPPRLGDTDLMRLSNKLNGVSCLIKDSLRAKIDFMFDHLYNEFLEMDPKGTGYITPKQLTNVLSELCLHVSNREIDDLIKKFDIHKDGKISYIALLQPFIRKRLLHSNVLHNKSIIHNLANNILSINEVNKQLKLSTLLPILYEIQPKLPISRLNWNKMYRSMKQADPTNCGRLNVTVFKDLYQNGTGIHLTDEQLYQLLTILDPHITNTLPYTNLLDVIQSQIFTNDIQTNQLGIDDEYDHFNKELDLQHQQENTLNVN
ncbi:hypothetical protein MN116_007541 [Schistosoma mekongi]|uniref:EF-hand domain-containing protein n=1 Tax=Schistosoma mekongi TaxID=38744 RepID=A0AAE1Z810_SCHME|nr:hypothetical protein MN116_007541 [Schistosoma mekongi]